MKDLIKKLRNYEIRIRKAVQSQMQGDFSSVFKGSGLEFDDVRPYQYGDDVRHIDWNVSAKGHGAFIKTFKEEKEQQVFFLVDVSASQKIGAQSRQKFDIAREICGVLALSAIKENSATGLLCFSDEKEKYVKPGKGVPHAYRLLYDVLKLQPRSAQTNLKKAVATTLALLKHKSLVVWLSDFIDQDYERDLASLAAKHDLVLIHVADQRETDLPELGIIPVRDTETGTVYWADTSSEIFKQNIGGTHANRKAHLSAVCRRYNANYLYVPTHEDYVPLLVKLFKVRKHM